MKERPILFSTEMVQAILDGRKTQTRRVVKPQPPSNNNNWQIALSISSTDKKLEGKHAWLLLDDSEIKESGDEYFRNPYGLNGDLLYVRETWMPAGWSENGDDWCIQYKAGQPSIIVDHLFDDEQKQEDFWIKLSDELTEAGCPETGGMFEDVTSYLSWRPSIFLPKNAARIWLRVKSVRVDRVQNITAEEIQAEGVRISTSSEGYPIIDISSKHSPAKYLHPGELDISNPPVTEERLFEIHWAALWDSINADRGFSWESNPWVWAVEFEVVSTTGKPEDL